MHLVFDIFQGIGVAAAVGVRPFLPAAVVGGLAAGDVELTFRHTDFHFLQQPVFIIAMVVAAVLFAALQWRTDRPRARTALSALLAVVALLAGALLCGGAIARSHHADWIGIAAGLVAAAVGIAATQPLLTRVRSRLDDDTRAILPALTEIAAAIGAGLSIVAPPIGVILVAALLWLLVVGRGRSEQKYAGLRILR